VRHATIPVEYQINTSNGRPPERGVQPPRGAP